MLNKIIIEGVIGWDVTPSDVRRQLNRFAGKDVLIEINSPGGFIDDGIQIFNDISKHDGKTETRITSLAASMGSYIALAGDKRSADSNATYMIHNALALMYGNHHDFRHGANILEGLSNIIATEYVNVTGKTPEEIHKLMDAESYFFGEEIKTAGFVDEIIESKNKKSDPAQAVAMARYNFAEAMKIVKSNHEPEQNIFRAAAMAGLNIRSNIKNKELKQPQEHKNMSLSELLAANPSAKIEYDAALSQAKKEGMEDEKKASAARVDSVKTYMTKESLEKYPESIDLIMDVISGEGKVSAITSMLAMVDRINQKSASLLAQSETGKQGHTPGQQAGGTGISETGDVLDEKGMQAVVDRLKGV